MARIARTVAVLIVAGAPRRAAASRCRRLAGAGARFAGAARLDGARWLLGGGHIDGRDQVVAAARLRGRRALVLVVSATAGAGTGEYQLVGDARVAAGRRLDAVVDGFVCLVCCDCWWKQWRWGGKGGGRGGGG